jgi:hypothetical protein
MDVYNSKIAAFVGWINKVDGGYAVTIGARTTLYSLSKEEVLADPIWMNHELRHRWQIADYQHKYGKVRGWLTFMYLYLLQNFTVGYYKNRYEVDANKQSGGN